MLNTPRKNQPDGFVSVIVSAAEDVALSVESVNIGETGEPSSSSAGAIIGALAGVFFVGGAAFAAHKYKPFASFREKRKGMSKQDSLADDLPPGWTSHLDVSTGRTYYFNKTTKQTQWKKPKVAKATYEPDEPEDEVKAITSGDISTTVSIQMSTIVQPNV